MIRNLFMAGAAFAVLAACNASGGTPVPQTEADKLKLAGEIATLMSDPKMVDGILDSMASTAMPTMRNICEAAPEAQRYECQDRVEKMRPAMEATMKEGMDQVKAMIPELMQEMGAIMARVYTGEELAKMMDYYSSPEGRSVVEKQPKVMAEYMPKMMDRMQAMQIEMMRKMQQRVIDALDKDGIKPTEPPI